MVKGGDDMSKQELARESFKQLVYTVQKSSKKRKTYKNVCLS